MKILTPDAKYTIQLSDRLEGKNLKDSQNVVREAWIENVYQINQGDFYDTGIFIDIGANIGAVSLKVASFNDNRDEGKKLIKVYAYEPQKNNFDDINANVINNNKQHDITIINKALGGHRMIVGISNEGGNSKIINFSEDVISMIRLEDVFIDNGIEECDVLKMDIEGYEYETLIGASKDTLKRIKYLTLEFDKTDEETFGALIAHLAEIFNIHIIGRPSNGGYIYGRRY